LQIDRQTDRQTALEQLLLLPALKAEVLIPLLIISNLFFYQHKIKKPRCTKHFQALFQDLLRIDLIAA